MSGTTFAMSSPSAAQRDREQLRAARLVMRLSLIIGVMMLVGKTAADFMTGSAGRAHAICAELDVHYHGVRFRTTGYRQIIKVHLLFPHPHACGRRPSQSNSVGCQGSCPGPPKRSLTWNRWKTTRPSTRREHYTGRPE